MQIRKILALLLAGCLISVGLADAKTRKTAKRNRASGKRTAPVRQRGPTPERYMEIQQALADKGHYQGPIDGNWGQDCVEALKRFQSEKNIAADGKLGALSLIALGLGPRREPLPSQFTGKPALE